MLFPHGTRQTPSFSNNAPLSLSLSLSLSHTHTHTHTHITPFAKLQAFHLFFFSIYLQNKIPIISPQKNPYFLFLPYLNTPTSSPSLILLHSSKLPKLTSLHSPRSLSFQWHHRSSHSLFCVLWPSGPLI